MQVLAAICVSLTGISMGADMALTSAAIFAFQKDLDDHIKMSLQEASWLHKREIYSKMKVQSDLTPLLRAIQFQLHC